MTNEVRSKIQALRVVSGLTYSAIAEECGVSSSTVYRVLNPARAESDRKAARRWKNANREVNRARDRKHYWQEREGINARRRERYQRKSINARRREHYQRKKYGGRYASHPSPFYRLLWEMGEGL